MKFLFYSIVLMIFSFSSMAKTLVCMKKEGIKACQEEAKEFCEGSEFSIRSSSDQYTVTCEGTSELSSKKTTENRNGINGEDLAEWRFAIGLGYNASGSAESDFSIQNLSTLSRANGEVDLDTEPGFNINFEARFLQKHGWGLTMGLDFDFDREVKSGTISSGGTTISVSETDDPDSFTSVVGYGNLVYKWENFYIPFGLNLSYIDYKSTGLNVNTTPSIGAQLGLGYETDSNFALEMYSRVLGLEMDYIDGNYDVSFEEGLISNIAFRVKYIFL